MTPVELDPRFTFDTFVVGAANRLASAAARRVAEAPGATYNPLFIYSASGLGKTHLATAIGHQSRKVQADLRILYDTLEQFMGDVMAAIEAGERDAFRSSLGEIGLLILDDVQFLAGRHRTQEELLRIWDATLARGGQVVLTSDRPPQEIDGLDERLLSRFSGGLIVDIGAPDYETRIAIVNRKAEERGQALAEGVGAALARTVFGSVRELQGALNRLLAVQELEGRVVTVEDVAEILGGEAGGGGGGEFENFLAEIADTVEEVVDRTASERRIANAILRWEGEGYRTRRLEAALEDTLEDDEVEAVVRTFEADVERLREIAGEIAALEPEAPERVRRDLLRDPDRLDEAEALLEEVRERTRPLRPPPEGFSFDRLSLPPDLFAVRAAIAAAEQPGERYNPLYIHGPVGSGKTALLAALGERLERARPDAPVAYVDGAAFANELIQALERNRVEGWRARYRRAGALLLDNLDALAGTERAQEELFHLFEALHRSGAQLAFAAVRAPHELDGIEERLRTRLESGLVVELPATRVDDVAGSEVDGVGAVQDQPGAETEPTHSEGESEPAGADGESKPGDAEGEGDSAAGEQGGEAKAAAGVASPALDEGAPQRPAATAATAAASETGAAATSNVGTDPWFLSREKVLWDWPYVQDRLIEEWD